MADHIVSQVQIEIDQTCPVCKKPNTKSVVRRDETFTNLLICHLICARGHIWQLRYAENQEDWL